MEINSIMVIGSGQMGSGIAQVAAQSGIRVLLHDMTDEQVKKGLAVIHKNLSRDVEKGRMTKEDLEEIIDRISLSTSLTDAENVHLVVEAIVENLGVKQNLFRKMDEMVPTSTILASNTSSLMITELASVTSRPAQVIGMHFMNPVPKMKLVEVFRGLETTEEVSRAVHELSKRMGKIPIEINDFPGFISNRVLLPMLNEAIYCVYEGVAKPEAVDEIMKLGMNHPMGPLALADLIGLDTCLSIMEVLYEGFGDSKYRPCPLLRKYVKAGWLGRKSGRGFYIYK
ncbi:3-hydroxybutyryl-CoA dehydrogenase [Ammoniphilus sp. 3BR4]|uniref:3-hydroxybutyryl-CoA dehydrogenase n=1 Tax=Ammoniphilus sp. 3BR4 TaxID=3158265 RepID=UPI003464ED2D